MWTNEYRPATHKNCPRTRRLAKMLRKSGPMIERKLRKALQIQSKAFNVKFHYQCAVDPYVVDFMCLAVRLAVEIDGMSHDTDPAYEKKREDFLKGQGFHILHFTNSDVERDPIAVAAAICEEACQLQSQNWKKEPHPAAAKAAATLPQGEGRPASNLAHDCEPTAQAASS